MPKIDWIIEILANGVYCAKCGKVEDHFPDYICNAHTHGMAKYGHLDFQIVIYLHRALSKHSTVPLESAMMVGRMGMQDALLQDETKRELVAAVNALADVEKDILIRRYYYEQKPREIAKALDLPLKQVENHLYRSKQKLRKAISVC